MQASATGDELDASGFESLADSHKSGGHGPALPYFEAGDRSLADAASGGKLVLVDAKEAAGRSALGWSNVHALIMPLPHS
jgi:hypothetical protein